MLKLPNHARAGPWLLVISALLAAMIGAVSTVEILLAADPAASSPQVVIKKHSTGKEATVRHGEKEWFILIDVDQDRTMIIRTESNKGKEINNAPEIIERPMSNAEVDRIINDFVAGIKSTLKP